MKHNLKITLILLAFFLLAQFTGLLIVHKFATKELPYGIKPPELEKEVSFLPIFIIILVTTFFAIILAKFRVSFLWKFWFFISVVLCLSIALSAFLQQAIAFFIAIVLAFYKVIKPNLVIHNVTELFIYGGIAAILVNIFNIYSISILLVLISIYDYIAVRKTKHMISLAKFQTRLRIFAGLLIPYGKERAILGGGDIGFPLLFTAVAVRYYGYYAFIIPFFTTFALFLLFLRSEKKKFYPAMPFITIGCFAGYLAMLLLI